MAAGRTGAQEQQSVLSPVRFRAPDQKSVLSPLRFRVQDRLDPTGSRHRGGITQHAQFVQGQAAAAAVAAAAAAAAAASAGWQLVFSQQQHK